MRKVVRRYSAGLESLQEHVGLHEGISESIAPASRLAFANEDVPRSGERRQLYDPIVVIAD